MEQVLPIQRFPKLALLLLGALLGYAVAASALWAYQAHQIFESDRSLHANPSDFPYPVIDVAVPVSSRGHAPETLRGWWIPAAKPGAKAVLYLHGNDGNMSTSIGEVGPLRELGYSVFLIDYRGFGASEGAFPSEASVYEDAEAAWRHLTGTVRVKPSDLFIYGHSLGGAVAIELARRHPEAAGLVVESGFTSIYEMAMLDRRYSVFPLGLFLNQRFESIGKVAELALPVLYIHGTADEVVPHDMGLRLFLASGGAKRFISIEGGRHDNNSFVGGAAFRAAIGAFVGDTAGLQSLALRRAAP